MLVSQNIKYIELEKIDNKEKKLTRNEIIMIMGQNDEHREKIAQKEFEGHNDDEVGEKNLINDCDGYAAEGNYMMGGKRKTKIDFLLYDALTYTSLVLLGRTTNASGERRKQRR